MSDTTSTTKPGEIMREIHTHQINPANREIGVIALDGPGPGGASHDYTFETGQNEADGRAAYEAYFQHCDGKSLISGAPLPTWDAQDRRIQIGWMRAAAAPKRSPRIAFQNGPVKENGEGVNGLTHEALLAVILDRLHAFQAGPYACRENALAITRLEEGMHWLHHRTRARELRGVEGTMKP